MEARFHNFEDVYQMFYFLVNSHGSSRQKSTIEDISMPPQPLPINNTNCWKKNMAAIFRGIPHFEKKFRISIEKKNHLHHIFQTRHACSVLVLWGIRVILQFSWKILMVEVLKITLKIYVPYWVISFQYL